MRNEISADLPKLKKLANKIRTHAVRMTHTGGSSHVGSVLSIADILAVLYGSVLRFDVNNPLWNSRDRFILSKGHAGAGVYAALAEVGFFEVSKLKTHYQNGSDLSGHVSHKGVPGVEFSTGSLGHGLPVACGIAKGARLSSEDYRVFVLMSDGECDEGSIWEAAMFAAHHRLSNLTVIIDRNRLQSIKSTEDTLALEPFADKWEAFGWDVEQCNAHNISELLESISRIGQKPRVVIANSIKGKGVSFMENSVLWHYRSPQGKEYELAMSELEAQIEG